MAGVIQAARQRIGMGQPCGAIGVCPVRIEPI